MEGVLRCSAGCLPTLALSWISMVRGRLLKALRLGSGGQLRYFGMGLGGERMQIPEWVEQAACAAPDVDPEIFFPARTTNSQALRQARVICLQCPVLAECRAYAAARPHLCGIWGGELRQVSPGASLQREHRQRVRNA